MHSLRLTVKVILFYFITFSKHSNISRNKGGKQINVSCSPVALCDLRLQLNSFSVILFPQISRPVESSCAACFIIYSSIPVLNDCLKAPPLLAAFSATPALCPHYHADLYFQKYNSLIIPAVIVFVRGAEPGRGSSEEAFMCDAARVHLFPTSFEKERGRSTAVYSLSLRKRRRARRSFGFWQRCDGTRFD